ncbi:hypothetical protein NXS98_17605 [Fontisphaera persica]|uniref:hypothetical protein n=1 Tax=Fontisphaera persica TaxID=2974023 RepID=UPI0024C05BA1|nr:hypothetical protein [Fontisphaera persica]WCJ59508.1 hypothetical protein NXS98_17605 [Fontisphaera persica]
MRTTLNPQQGLLDCLMPTPPSNSFLDQLQAAVNWQPIEQVLHRMYPARTGRPPHPPLGRFKMCLLKQCYDLSDRQSTNHW